MTFLFLNSSASLKSCECKILPGKLFIPSYSGIKGTEKCPEATTTLSKNSFVILLSILFFEVTLN